MGSYNEKEKRKFYIIRNRDCKTTLRTKLGPKHHFKSDYTYHTYNMIGLMHDRCLVFVLYT